MKIISMITILIPILIMKAKMIAFISTIDVLAEVIEFSKTENLSK